MTKIGLIIPSTTKGLNCKTYKDSPLFKIFLRSFYKTYNNDLEYKLYLVIDHDDDIYSQEKEKKGLESFINLIKNVEIQIIPSNIEKGWVTKMWNLAFKMAYDDDCDYFYQCGDDIEFMDKDWTKDCINILKSHNDEGVTGPIDYGRHMWALENNKKQKFLLTQTFVSRKHMEIFGFYFPKEIKNWFCDDWMTYVYATKNKAWICKKRIINKGGSPRYEPVGKGKDFQRMTLVCRNLIEKYNRLL